MRNLVRNAIIVVVAILIAVWAIVPPAEKLRRGKDLAGGVSLVYSVDIEPGESPRDVLARVIEVLRERVDPRGQLEITMTAQGNNRIEITMPLPSEHVKGLRQEFEAALASLAVDAISEDELDRIVRLEPAQREVELRERAGDDAEQLAAMRDAAAAFDEIGAARAAFESQQRVVDDLRGQLRQVEEETPDIGQEGLADLIRAAIAEEAAKLDRAAEAAAIAELAYEEARERAVRAALTPTELRRALALPDREQRLRDDATGERLVLPSPRNAAIQRLKDRYPAEAAHIDQIVEAWNRYEAQRRTLDDPSDLIRLLRGAGVLNFRIAVKPNEAPDEIALREQLREAGPQAARSESGRWFKINRIENWYDSVQQFRAMTEDPGGYFAARGYVVEEFDGQFYMLLRDSPGSRLTEADGAWSLARAYPSRDDLGRDAISFEMDPVGAQRLGRLTEANIGNAMAVLLDDEVYTAPTIQGAISGRGQITGGFSKAEIRYIVQVLSAGSLQAKLSPEPISRSVLGPQLGADNLQRGMRAGWIALVGVSVFMVCYYFFAGTVAVIALLVNGLLIVGAMALQSAAFTLPGIAGVILTFGMAVDANVLIYERMREELLNGEDVKTSVRLGYQRALSSIVDGNVTNLIVCVVLGFVGTPEIKGFAITLGIGVVTTMFTALFVTRLIFELAVQVGGMRRIRMLPMVIPAIERALTPRIDWIGLRWVFMGVSACFVGLAIAMIAIQGETMLANEFRGGTEVTIQLRQDEGGRQMLLTRQEVEDRVRDIAREGGQNLGELINAEIVVVDPEADGFRSGRFIIRTVLTDTEAVLAGLTSAFEDVVESRPALTFDAAEVADLRRAPVYPIVGAVLGESIDRPDVRNGVGDMVGGVAIVLEDIEPAPSAASLEERLRQLRAQPDFADTLGRQQRIVVLEGSDARVRTAVVLVRDPNLGYFQDNRLWNERVAAVEWGLVREALTSTTTLASVQSFSPSIARTFRANAIVAVLLSAVLIVVYVYVRFGSFRYSFAAISTTLHDCLIAVGLIAFAEILYEHLPGVARPLGILPFKIDLNLVAAILTILGYSLNDTIVIMDRIRENRGKLPHASREVINLSINQTMSRTLITSGTTLVATLVLYVVGGEGVRQFAYALMVGIVVGTFSTIGVAAPMVWVRKTEQSPVFPDDERR